MIKIDVTKHWFGTSFNDDQQGSIGNDVFHQSAGFDTFDGGSGYDTLTYSNSGQAVVVDARNEMGTVSYKGPGKFDTFHSIEKIVGSQHSDIVWAGATTDVDAGAGDDWIVSGSGANKLNGGGGSDTVSYADSTAGVDVQLQYYVTPYAHVPRAAGGWAEGDILTGFENIKGSEFNDVLGGDGAANTLWGYGGNDTMRGHGGDDVLYGDEGYDEIYGGQGKDELNGGDGNDLLQGDQGHDIVNGGDGDDILAGGIGNDFLWGGEGGDTLYGGDGNDQMLGGHGSDTHYGGSGADIFMYFATQDSPGAGTTNFQYADKIMDFSKADGDKIDLSVIDADWLQEGHQTFSTNLLYSPYPWAENADFAVGQIAVSHIFNDTYVQLNMFDSNTTDGTELPEMVIMLAGHHDLTADDFIL